MAYDYTQNKTPIFTGINDQPQQATSNQGSNASDLIAKVNSTLDNLVNDLTSLENDNVDAWDADTTIFFDTVSGDDTNDGLTNSTPKQTLVSAIDKAKEKAIAVLSIEQLDSANALSFNSSNGNKINLSGLKSKYVKLDYTYSGEGMGDVFSPVLKLVNVNLTFDLSPDNFPENDEINFPSLAFVSDDGARDDLTISFVNATLNFDRPLIFKNDFLWHFINCTINDTANNGFYCFAFITNYENHRNSERLLSAYFDECSFVTANGATRLTSFASGDYKIALRNCNFEGGSWGSIVYFGNFGGLFFGTKDFASSVTWFVSNLGLANGGTITDWGFWGDSKTRKTFVVDDFSSFLSNIDATEINAFGIEVLDSSFDLYKTVKELGDANLLSSLNTLQTDVGNLQPRVTDLEAQTPVRQALRNIVTDLKPHVLITATSGGSGEGGLDNTGILIDTGTGRIALSSFRSSENVVSVVLSKEKDKFWLIKDDATYTIWDITTDDTSVSGSLNDDVIFERFSVINTITNEETRFFTDKNTNRFIGYDTVNQNYIEFDLDEKYKIQTNDNIGANIVNDVVYARDEFNIVALFPAIELGTNNDQYGVVAYKTGGNSIFDTFSELSNGSDAVAVTADLINERCFLTIDDEIIELSFGASSLLEGARLAVTNPSSESPTFRDVIYHERFIYAVATGTGNGIYKISESANVFTVEKYTDINFGNKPKMRIFQNMIYVADDNALRIFDFDLNEKYFTSLDLENNSVITDLIIFTPLL